MSENEKDDDAYVIEDTGESVADIEQEMEAAAREAAAETPAAAAQNEDYRDRYMRTLADFEKLPVKPEVRQKILKLNAARLLGLADG